MRKKRLVKKEKDVSDVSDVSYVSPGYTIVDRRGQPKAFGLYESPTSSPHRYRPRYYTSCDTSKGVTAYDRQDYMSLGRSLFAQCPDLGGALLSKASWAVGPGSYMPIYHGTNRTWGDEAEEWLVNQFFPVCSIMGNNYTFQTLLYLSSLALDIDGDTGLFFTTSRNGYPLVGLIPSHRIGQRNKMEKIVKNGRFMGYRIIDGVIVNDNGRNIGYRILGETEEDDYDISVQNFNLLFEPEWADQYRGISRLAKSLTDWADQQDINEFLKRGIKLASSVGLLSHTEQGDAVSAGANIVGMEEDGFVSGGTDNGVSIESIRGGEILYMKAGLNEKIEGLKDERPSPNTEAFIERIQRRAMYSIGWCQEMLDASKIGGASVRLVQDLVRKSIASRQATLDRRAKIIVNYALAKAMNLGIISQNNDDWYKWSFTKGGVISVDNGHEADADRQGYVMGLSTMSEISAKKGRDWYEIREQQFQETEDLLDRAVLLSKKYNISMQDALVLLSQRATVQWSSNTANTEKTETD